VCLNNNRHNLCTVHTYIIIRLCCTGHLLTENMRIQRYNEYPCTLSTIQFSIYLHIVIFHILSRLIGSHVACYSCRLYLVFPSTVPKLLLQLAIVSYYTAHDTTTFLQAENRAIEIALSRRIQKHARTRGVITCNTLWSEFDFTELAFDRCLGG